jgi:hypothetical protein
MDMFGGLTKTSSRIAIAAALGLTLGGFAFKATPAQAADLGGDCCADLEERVAELEATTVRKGNKKVSVTISGWVVKSMNFWDDGDEDHFVVGDKDYDLGTRFAITGSATIAPGWSGGFNITVNTWGDCFGTGANQVNDLAGCAGSTGTGFSDIGTLYSYIYIKSDTWGTLNWGHLSPASDNPAVLADISGTVIESNGVWFEGPGFFLRAKGEGNNLSTLTWGDFLLCQGLGAGIGVDCWGVAQPAVRYDSPTWGGFRFQASYGKNQLTGAFGTPDTDFADVAVYYTADWNSIKVSAAAAYTWIESAAVPSIAFGDEGNLFQVGGSIMHKPSGLGIYAMGQWEETDGRNSATIGLTSVTIDAITISNPPPNLNIDLLFADGQFTVFDRGNQSTDAWYIKPFWRKVWWPAGATVLYGEFGQYNDQFANGRNLCTAGFGLGSNLGNFCADQLIIGDIIAGVSTTPIPGALVRGAFADGSEVQRWGLGAVQEIDSAAMHLWARWQHQEIDVDITGFSLSGENCFGGINPDECTVNKTRIKQDFDDWDLFQVGGIIFF